FMAQHRIDHVSLLKIDVEGWEVGVLRGAGERLRNIGIILFECSWLLDANKGLRPIVDLLQQYDFHVWRMGVAAFSKIEGEAWNNCYEGDKPWSNCLAMQRSHPFLELMLERFRFCAV